MAAEQLANVVTTTLATAIDASQTSLVVASATGYPSSGTFRILIDLEILTVTAVSGTLWTVTRGSEGTTGIAHAAGATVRNILTAGSVVQSALDMRPGGLFINSNFDHFQRSTGTVTSTTTFNRLTSFAADRFFVRPVGASVTQARSTTVPNTRARYSLLVTGAASVTTVDIGQRIAAATMAARGQQPLVMVAQVYNGSGGAFAPLLRVDTPAAADDYTTPTNRLSTAMSSCANAAWTSLTYAFDPSAYPNLVNGAEISLRIPSGSIASGQLVRVAQFDIVPASQAFAYVAPDPDLELLRCLEYAEVIGGSATNENLSAGPAISTSQMAGVFNYSRKRRIPNISFSAASDFAVQHGLYTLVACTTIAANNAGLNSCLVQLDVATTPFTLNWSVMARANSANARAYSLAEIE